MKLIALRVIKAQIQLSLLQETSHQLLILSTLYRKLYKILVIKLIHESIQGLKLTETIDPAPYNELSINVNKTYPRTCACSEDSDQPAHSRSLIRIFTGYILDS